MAHASSGRSALRQAQGAANQRRSIFDKWRRYGTFVRINDVLRNMHLYGTMLLEGRMNKKDLQLFRIAGQGFDLIETRWNARLLEQCVDSAETLSAID